MQPAPRSGGRPRPQAADAQADGGRVSLTRAADVVELRVEDDGRGMDHTGRPGIGLHGIRERLAPFGGGLTLTDARAGGTVLIASVPLQATTNQNIERRAA